MTIEPTEALETGQCVPCEGGIPTLTPEERIALLAQVRDWKIASDGLSISKKWNCKSFVRALAFCNRIGELAEQEQHHPDLHITGYRHVEVVLTTHAVGGLTRNDFILAAKISSLRN